MVPVTPTTGNLILIGGPDSNSATRRMATHLAVNPGQLGSLGREGYRIKTTVTDGRRVTLVAGGGGVGTLYAAYDLLYRMGCRWFAPGASHESVPHISDIPDLDVTQRPSFFTRGFHAWENRGDVDFLLWMARNRLNYWCTGDRLFRYRRPIADAQSGFLPKGNRLGQSLRTLDGRRPGTWVLQPLTMARGNVV